MGGVNSTVIDSKEVLQVINEVVIQNIQSCNQNTDVNQVINISGDNVKIENLLANQTVNANLQCFSNTTNQINLVNDLTAALTNKANSAAKFFLGFSANVAVIKAETVEQIIQKNMISNIQRCAQENSYEQGYNISGDYVTVLNNTLNQNGNLFCNCIFSADSVTNIADEISADMNNQATASSSMGLASIITIIIIVIAIVIGAAVALWLFKKARQTPYPPRSPALIK